VVSIDRSSFKKGTISQKLSPMLLYIVGKLSV